MTAEEVSPNHLVGFFFDVLLNAFLDWTQRKKAPRTYDSYKRYCSSLANYLPSGMKVSKLKPHHVESWFDDKFPNATETTRGIAYRTVKRAFNWAAQQEHIPESPIKRLKVPSGQSREIYIEPEQFEEFTRHASPRIKDIATFLWNTGCRPFEAYHLESRHLNDGCCVFESEESKGKKSKRVVPLDDAMWELVSQLASKHTTGAIFRNTKGNPWNADSLNSAFDRIEKKVNFKVYPYAFRPSGALTACVQGLEGITLFRGFDFDPKLIDGVNSIQSGHDTFVFYERPQIPVPRVPGIVFRLVSLNGLRFISREPSRILISYYNTGFGK